MLYPGGILNSSGQILPYEGDTIGGGITPYYYGNDEENKGLDDLLNPKF